MSPLAAAIIKAVLPLLSQMLRLEIFPKKSLASLYLAKIAIMNGLSPSSFLSSTISGNYAQNFSRISIFFSVIQKCSIVSPFPNTDTPFLSNEFILSTSALMTAILRSS
jgi:hypothetical protein